MAYQMHHPFGMKPTNNRAAARAGANNNQMDASLDREDCRETNGIGQTATAVVADEEPLGGPDNFERRDGYRAEFDPSASDKLPIVVDTSRKWPSVRIRKRSRASAGER